MRYISVHKFKSFFIILLSFFIFIAIAKSQSKETVYIPYTGDKDSFILELEEKGLLTNGVSKLILQAILSFKQDLEPGTYVFSKGMGAVSTAVALDQPEYKYVSIQEGFRKGQIAQIIGTRLNWEEEKINIFGEVQPICPLKGQEGYLASGTYLIHVEEDVKIVEETMQNTFHEALDEMGIKEKDVSIPQIITIASLIQREAAGKADMRLISGIIHNRLEIGMPLQIDATLQYIKGNEEEWWPVPKSEDKKLESPYNTYQNLGLPPTPIATPGKEAIKAALNPMKTDCIFYLHDKRRNIHCSITYEQHKRNVKYYLQ
jgi:UPF0755 protein